MMAISLDTSAERRAFSETRSALAEARVATDLERLSMAGTRGLLLMLMSLPFTLTPTAVEWVILPMDCDAERSISPLPHNNQSEFRLGNLLRISEIVCPESELCSPFPLKVEG